VVALVGSRVGDLAAPGSDYDVFIYTEGDLADLRAEMAGGLADASSWRSIREHAFGEEDAWRLGAGGPWLDLMYWSTTWAERQLDELLVHDRGRIGYSTAFWRSIHVEQPLYEPDAWHADLQTAAEGPLRAFYNVYLDRGLGVPTEQIGGIIGLAQLLPVAGALLTVNLLARWGAARTLALESIGTAVALLPLAGIPLLGMAALGFMRVMTMAAVHGPAHSVFSQELVGMLVGPKSPWRNTG